MHVLNQTRCIYMYMYMYMSPYKHTDTYTCTCTCICTYTLYVYIFTHCYIAMLKFHFSTVIRVFLPHLTSLPHAVCVCPITCILMCVMCISTCNSKTDIHLYVYMYMYMYTSTCTCTCICIHVHCTCMLELHGIGKLDVLHQSCKHHRKCSCMYMYMYIVPAVSSVKSCKLHVHVHVHVHCNPTLELTATGLPAMNRITDVVLVAANAATDVTLSPVAKYVYVLFTL